jgi:hypothetical protein
MNEKLNDAISRLSNLPEDRQEAAAMLLLDFLDQEEGAELTPEEISELEQFLEEVAAAEMVKDFFARARAQGDRSKS